MMHALPVAVEVTLVRTVTTVVMVAVVDVVVWVSTPLVDVDVTEYTAVLVTVVE